MSGVLEFVLWNSRVRGVACSGLVLGLSVMLAACSGNVSRFDYAAFSHNSGDGSLTTGSLSPIPAEPVYQNGSPANSTAVVRQDLPPPQSQHVAAAEPRPVEPAPLPPQPQPQYQAPPPAPAQYQPPPPPASRTVRVRRGDTLYKLSNRYGASIDEIKSANKLRSTRLSIGQELIIPGEGTAPEVTTTTYTVRRGDSLAKIAGAHGISQRELQKANGITRPNVLQPGQKLKIPGQIVEKSEAPIRVASRGPSAPLPATNPARSKRMAAAPPGTSIASPRPQQKVAARTPSLPNPEPMAGNQFRWPVRGRIVSGFGAKSSGKHNDGINVAVPKGTSIKAAENGVVAYAGNELEPYGNLILIRHANNWVTAYAHNDKLLVKRGDTVQRGQIIAKAGQSGSVSQPQLHFELRRGSKPVNPLSYMASS